MFNKEDIVYCFEKQMTSIKKRISENDLAIINSHGGATKLSKVLGFDSGGPQRICNWKKRGIPAQVKLDHPDIFLVKSTSND